MIRCAGVGRRFGPVRAVWDADLDIAAGESVAIVGANGSGKSTLLKLIAGLLRPTKGSVLVNGSEPRTIKENIGYLGHDHYLFPHLSVAENLDLYARLYGAPRERPRTLLEMVGMSAKRDAPVFSLSRGQTQRVALARALVNDPDVLLLDEPFTGLDDASSERVPGLVRKEGRTLLVVTHDTSRTQAITTRVIRMDEGRLT